MTGLAQQSDSGGDMARILFQSFRAMESLAALRASGIRNLLAISSQAFPISQVAQILGCGRLEILLMVREFIRDATFRRHLESVLASCKGVFEAIALLYTICRTVRPRVVVELGVASGVSSAMGSSTKSSPSMGTNPRRYSRCGAKVGRESTRSTWHCMTATIARKPSQ